MKGVGAVLREEFVYEHADHAPAGTDVTGTPHTQDHWFYKAPVSLDVPNHFNVRYLQDSVFEKGVFGSKTAGEPAVNCSVSVVAAMYMAVLAARKDAGNQDWVQLDCPMTLDKLSIT